MSIFNKKITLQLRQIEIIDLSLHVCFFLPFPTVVHPTTSGYIHHFVCFDMCMLCQEYRDKTCGPDQTLDFTQ